MAHKVSVGVSGSFKEIRPWWVGTGGNWKKVLLAHVGVGGSWKLYYSDIPETLIALFDAAFSSPWSAISYTGLFPLGGTSEGGSDLYSNNHQHTTSVTNVVGQSTLEQAQNASDYHTVLNYHSTIHNNDHSHSSDTDHTPLYQEWRGATAAGAIEIPTGAHLFWGGSGSIPTGWTRSTFTNDRYVRLNSSGTGGTGGNVNHTHTHSNTASGSSAVDRQQNYFSYPYHQANASHAHTIPAHTSANHEPLFCNLDMVHPSSATNVIPAGIVAFFLGSVVPAGWEQYTLCNGRLVRLSSVATPGTQGGTSGHGHVMSGVTGGSYTGSSLKRGADGTYAANYPHAHPNTHTHDVESNNWMPLSRQLLICKKL